MFSVKNLALVPLKVSSALIIFAVRGKVLLFFLKRKKNESGGRRGDGFRERIFHCNVFVVDASSSRRQTR